MNFRHIATAAILIAPVFYGSPAFSQYDTYPTLPNPSHGFEMLEIVFQPQHPNVDDGIFKARVMFAAHSVPGSRGIVFYVEVDKVRNIEDVNAKVGAEVVKEADAMIRGWQADKDAFDRGGRNAFGDICASAPKDPGCHFVQEKPAPIRPEDERVAVPKNGYVIQYIALRPQIRGTMNGNFHAEISVTALSMPQIWDGKLHFEFDNVHSIEEIERKLPSMIDKEADETIEKLSKDRDAFDRPPPAKP